MGSTVREVRVCGRELERNAVATQRERGYDTGRRPSLVVELASDENPPNSAGFLFRNGSHVAEDLADGLAPGCSGLEFDYDDRAVGSLRGYVDEARSYGTLGTVINDGKDSDRYKVFNFVDVTRYTAPRC